MRPCQFPQHAPSRTGFTLIELMVAMALTLLIMAILSQAFVMALDTFTGLKGIGDMQQYLRTAAVALRSDLSNYHLDGARKLSDPTIVSPTAKIQAGFFVIRQGSALATTGPGYFDEGLDQNGVRSYRAVDHMLYFTVKRRGNRQEEFFTAPLVDNTPTPNALNIFFAVPIVVSSASQVGNVVTITTSSPHNFLVGNIVNITGVVIPGFSGPGYNGLFTITSVLSSSSFTYNNPVTGLAAGGGSSARATVGGNTAYNVAPGTLQIHTQTLPRSNPLSFYSSQWAEVLYYLEPTGTTEEANNPSGFGTPLFALKRAQFVMVPDSSAVTNQIDNGYFSTFTSMACNPNPAAPNRILFYSPLDAALGQRTINPATTTAADPRLAGVSTLVLPNVISFEVQVLRMGDPAFPDPPNVIGLYDTTRFADPTYPAANRVALRGIQVTMRIWDHKTRQTRQVTVVQDL